MLSPSEVYTYRSSRPIWFSDRGPVWTRIVPPASSRSRSVASMMQARLTALGNLDTLKPHAIDGRVQGVAIVDAGVADEFAPRAVDNDLWRWEADSHRDRGGNRNTGASTDDSEK